jgi:hypothetical protein
MDPQVDKLWIIYKSKTESKTNSKCCMKYNISFIQDNKQCTWNHPIDHHFEYRSKGVLF